MATVSSGGRRYPVHCLVRRGSSLELQTLPWPGQRFLVARTKNQPKRDGEDVRTDLNTPINRQSWEDIPSDDTFVHGAEYGCRAEPADS